MEQKFCFKRNKERTFPGGLCRPRTEPTHEEATDIGGGAETIPAALAVPRLEGGTCHETVEERARGCGRGDRPRRTGARGRRPHHRRQPRPGQRSVLVGG